MSLHRENIQTGFRRFEGARTNLRYNALGQLVLEYEGTEWEKVRPLRPFPLSAPQQCIFFRDKEGMEIGFVAGADELNPESQAVLEKELSLLYFTTRIDAIDDTKARHGVTTWNLKTPRGEKTIYVKDRNDIRSLAGRRTLFTDSNGMRFEIANIDKLDDRSQSLLEAET